VLADHAPQVANAFELGNVVGEMVFAARGELGRIWRLDTDRGSFAIKELMARQLAGDASLDVAYQEAVAAAETVPLPRPVRTASGEVLLDVGTHQVRAYEWVDLLPEDSTLDPALIGSTVAAMHRVQHPPTRPLNGWYTDPVGADRWAELLDLARGADAPFTEAFSDEIPYLIELEGLITVPTAVQMCHRDLWSDNFLPAAAGGVCVVDWENCGLEDPAQELPMVLFSFGGGDAGRTGDLYGTYRAAGGPGRLNGRGDFTMVIAQFGHFWEKDVAAYTAPDATDDVKAHSLGRIDEALSTPLRVEDIDRMLDWVAGAR
jgi:Ser/Thr protein kinase RdoA (MazF antagonist)